MTVTASIKRGLKFLRADEAAEREEKGESASH